MGLYMSSKVLVILQQWDEILISETFDFNLILLCNPILTSILSEDEKMLSSGLNSSLFERQMDNLHKRNQILKGFAEKKSD